jgi:pectin methylesterase-like acyl-CoA thioesterase
MKDTSVNKEGVYFMMRILLTTCIIIFQISILLAQTELYPAAALWELTNPDQGGTGLVPSTVGQVNGTDEFLNNMEINQYTGPDNSQRLRIEGNSWPANQTEQIDDVFIQFAVSPNTDFTFHADSIALKMCITAINHMKANLYYSTDPDFDTSTMIEYSTGLENNYLPRDVLTLFEFSISATVNSGETLYFRIYPWVYNDPDERTGKYICLQDVFIGGNIESNEVPAIIEWPFDTDQNPVTTGRVLSDLPTYSDSLKWYGIANETHKASDTQEDLNFGAVQTVSQVWYAEPDTLKTHWFQVEAMPKFGGTFYVDSVFMYLGAWFTENLRAAIYYSKDADFTQSEVLIEDTPLNGIELDPFGISISDTVETGEKIYIRFYPYNTQSEGWAKLVAISHLKIMGTVIGVTADPPNVETSPVSYISATFAQSGGNIPSDGGSIVTARGVVWNITGSPTIDDNKTEDGTGSGTYTSIAAGLTPGTDYYLRAYASNIAGTSYGEEVTFRTLDSTMVPAVVTGSISSVLVKSAEAAGEVTAWGGDTVTVKGFCWNTTGNPTINDSKSENGSGLGAYTGVLYPLTETTKYYYRAYATNSKGTGYGVIDSFTTQAPQSDVYKVVAKDGSGDYTSVQAAFNDVPDNYTGKWNILVKKGIYYEKLLLERTKINVVLEGEHRDSTILTYDDYSGRVVDDVTLGTSTSYSVAIDADDFVAKTITFQNTSTAAQAVALRTNGDRQAYYYCNMLGYQDTYYTWGGRGTGRIYNKNCYIEGSVDFIFGRDIAVFDSCIINENRNGGTLTAAATEPESQFGYTFLDCKITSDEIGFDGSPITSFVLGRPWQKEPRTVFIRCEEPATLNPAGWSTWNVTPALYAEYQCYGPGSDTGSRIDISRQLTDEEALDYTLENIFSKESNPRYAYDWMPENIVITALEDKKDNFDEIPKNYGLEQNYPNPFNPSTTIRYNLPEKAHVELIIYNVLGEKVKMLINKEMPAGIHKYTIDMKNLPSGVYFYMIKTGSFKKTKKMMLIR